MEKLYTRIDINRTLMHLKFITMLLDKQTEYILGNRKMFSSFPYQV